LAFLYDQTKFEEIKHFEVREINFQNRYRAPLVVHLKDKVTETEFLVMNNHLARGKALVRQEQATQLVQWARIQLVPVVALGDYNFDYVFETKPRQHAGFCIRFWTGQGLGEAMPGDRQGRRFSGRRKHQRSSTV